MILALAHSATAQSTGTYSGNGNDNRAFTGLGFQPVVVIIKGDSGAEAYIRTSTMSGAKSLGSGSPIVSNHIQSLDADGFTIGDDNNVNEGSVDFYWVAFPALPWPQMQRGSYGGNGSSQSITGMAFSPEYVIVMSAAGHEPVHRSASMTTTYQFKGDGGSSGRVTSLDANGFTVGGILRSMKVAQPTITWPGTKCSGK